MDTEQKLSALKAEADAAKQKKLRAEMLAEAALTEREDALKDLKENFGVEDVEAAKAHLTQLNEELDIALQEAEKVLGEVT